MVLVHGLLLFGKGRSPLVLRWLTRGLAQAKDSTAASGSCSASQKEKTGPRSGKGGQADGWVSPAKLARRRSSSAMKVVIDTVAELSHSGEDLELRTKGKEAMPVQLGRAGSGALDSNPLSAEKGGSQGSCLNHSVVTKNPFASLVSAAGVVGHLDSRDAF